MQATNGQVEKLVWKKVLTYVYVQVINDAIDKKHKSIYCTYYVNTS